MSCEGNKTLSVRLSQNERRILDLIWRRQPISRVHLAEEAGLTTGSVTRITQVLSEHQLIRETIARDGSRGSPSRPLVVEPNAARAFGVSFSHTYLDVGLVNLGGDILALERRVFGEARPEAIAEAFRSGIADITRKHGHDALGIGIGVPGEFSQEKPFIRPHPYFPHLTRVDLRSVFSQGSALPVYIENDCNAAALGERVHGHGIEFRSFFSVFICHGIGGGVIIDGQLYRGSNGNSGGLHTFFPASQPRPSGHDLFDVLARDGGGVRDFCDLERSGSLDAPGVRPWIYRAGTQLQEALTRVARLFDPDAIVIGGRLPPEFLDEITKIIDTEQFCSDAPTAKPEVRASTLGPSAGIVGAAAVVFFENYFSGKVEHPSDNLISGRRHGAGG